jgi:hypothetical protein
MSFSDLPAVNASLNAFTAILLALGRYRRNRYVPPQSPVCGCASLLFLTCYVTYHTWMRQTPAPALKFLNRRSGQSTGDPISTWSVRCDSAPCRHHAACH